MKTKLIALLIAMTVSMPIMARSKVTVGAPDCGEWIKQPSNMKKAWLLGFMSGINLADSSDTDALKKTSSVDQIFVWMDNYCKANPLKEVFDGGMVLYNELLWKK